ncbi:endonuclease/exonuclease/phosphatase family protein [uncultured Croceicoccus sp.]|uniref:endonuclease/exonuclease/phosphatase family protein n=1 Tax=uncultured Croceicoccus sp. TaxID=1295329 RepID=UPI00262EB817|nr:endonuclease/exonuclease/phosphatase family protein [uncultured Croceicoccus sp.]
MRKGLKWILGIVAAVGLVLTLVSLIPSDQWFIRALDMTREPVMWAAIILAVVAVIVLRAGRWVVAGTFVVIAVIHLLRIWPYNALAGTDIALANPNDESAQCVTALAVNVKVKNDGYAEVIRQIERVSPDLLLLMETDATWERQLDPLLRQYDYRTQDIQPHAFGMIFASRVPVSGARMVENTSRDTPTLYATVALPNGRRFDFIGLHPKPPIPGMDTEERDANIVRAGTETPNGLPDALVMGDFNDVPWSTTTSKFRKEGDWRDPRIGRGTYPTFPADMTWLGWPLDQVMVRGDMELRDFTVMPANSSDHRAIRTTVCLGDRTAG